MTDVSTVGRVGVTRVRVRYAETDRMGVVYYANYLVWFEVARTDWLRDTGWSYRAMEADGTSLPVIESHCEYRRPAHYDDELDIRTRATLLSPVRIRFDYDVLWVPPSLGTEALSAKVAGGTWSGPTEVGPHVRADEPLPIASGYTVHAALDTQGRPCRLPSRVRTMLGRVLSAGGATPEGQPSDPVPPASTIKA